MVTGTTAVVMAKVVVVRGVLEVAMVAAVVTAAVWMILVILVVGGDEVGSLKCWL